MSSENHGLQPNPDNRRKSKGDPGKGRFSGRSDRAFADYYRSIKHNLDPDTQEPVILLTRKQQLLATLKELDDF